MQEENMLRERILKQTWYGNFFLDRDENNPIEKIPSLITETDAVRYAYY